MNCEMPFRIPMCWKFSNRHLLPITALNLCVLITIFFIFDVIPVSRRKLREIRTTAPYPRTSSSPLVEYHDTPNCSDACPVPSVPPCPRDAVNPLYVFYGHQELLSSPEVFTPRRTIITPLNYPFSIKSNVCPDKSSPLLLIMVLSVHDHIRERNSVRNTWGSVARDKPWPKRKLFGETKLVFLLGTHANEKLNEKVRAEAEVHGDIVMANFTESYYNLTLKVLTGYKWMKMFCPGAQFVMKIDEDSFPDIPRITNLLVSIEMQNTIYGPLAFSESVDRKIPKAKVSQEAYPAKWYPPHVKGNMYVMPNALALNILNVSVYFPYVNIEDAFITGILGKHFNAHHLNIPASLYNRHPKGELNVCSFVFEKTILAQQISPELAERFWRRIVSPELCGIL
ncbi:beta-1,3-galactosyltransferase 5-like isoform X1 [Haliotis rufescens]|uniref:beta-1,3-galactosyltransferase 5-like isoform X1 n=2 Tax=Haliotis rufescens TaxID=6454 RepID=UPI001EAFA13A|nr:beta-1,3-galactosyltransferase 5-like isoform X1 [Haliotis rufescens]